MLPTRQEAEMLVKDAEQYNPGPWGDHSRVAAYCAERIAALCGDMDAEKAYILGLLHDIGRKFGVKHLGHVYDGYKYMMDLGYDEVARICLTHSFSIPDIRVYIGNFDVSAEGLAVIEKELTGMVYDEYDKLIQLCDCLASAQGVVDITERMEDVRRRYGSYPQEKWNANMALLKYFGDKVGRDIYQVVK